MAESSGEEDDWKETECSVESGLCLFCSEEFSGGSTAVLDHCAEEHGFQLLQFVHRLNLDFYSCIKLINYIRKEHPDPSMLLAASVPYPWLPEHYMYPVITDDPLLQLDFELSEEPPGEGDDEDGLRKRLADTEQKVNQYQEALSHALTDLEVMRHAVQNIVGEEPSSGDHTPLEVMEPKLCEEEGYFGSYTHFKIHDEMLKDEARTETYKCFIEKNSRLFKDKVVLDIGCGTGILSLFAASAGAKLVIGIDQSNIIYNAMDIIRENGYEDRVLLIKGKVEEVTLPVDKVDIIMSEWMGYFLLYESMLDTVLYARDKWLDDPKNVFPNSCSLSLVAMGNCFEWESRVKYWENVYGFKMSCIRREALKEPAIQVIDQHSTISSSDTIKKFDLQKIQQEELDFEAPFSITMRHDTMFHALVGYFDVGFHGVEYPFDLSTSPQDIPTHWKQTIFYFQDPITVNTGDLMKGTLKCCKNKKDSRSLDIEIKFELLTFQSDDEPIRVEQKFVLE